MKTDFEKRLPWTYHEVLGYQGQQVDIRKAKQMVGRVGLYASNDLGDTPLSVASWLGCEEMAQWLLEQGADVDYTDARSRTGTPLLHACEQKQLECARILVEHGASLETINSFQHTPLSITFINCFTDPLPVATYLVQQGALITPRVKEMGGSWDKTRFQTWLQDILC